MRAEIKNSPLSGRQLAKKLNLSLDTIYKWRKRETFYDKSHKRHNLLSSINETEEEIIKELRTSLGLSVDDITEVMRRCVNPTLTRSSIYRAMKRCGVAKRSPEAGAATPPQRFEDVTECGHIHMDVKYLTKLQGKRSYLYVAIDRFTRYVYTEVLYNLEPATAAAFVKRFIAHFPYKVFKVVTDNGFEWTDRSSGGVKDKATGRHPVDLVCGQHTIRHQLTRIRRPQTNGMVERFNRRVNEALARKDKISANSGKNSFYSHEERNAFIFQFIESYNKTRLRCLNYKAPLEMLNRNQKEYNT